MFHKFHSIVLQETSRKTKKQWYLPSRGLGVNGLIISVVVALVVVVVVVGVVVVVVGVVVVVVGVVVVVVDVVVLDLSSSDTTLSTALNPRRLPLNDSLHGDLYITVISPVSLTMVSDGRREQQNLR